MSHLLILDLPGGNDTDILEAARAGGHRVTFLTATPAHYLAQHDIAALLACASVIEAPACELASIAAAHKADPFDAVLCLQDLRIVEAARIAQSLGLRHLNPTTAALARDKAATRAALAQAGIPQPPSRATHGPAELIAAVEDIGLPVIVKPIDGFGSQNIFAIRDAADLARLREMADLIADAPGDYGLGVAAQGAMLVERLLHGQVIACDTMSAEGRHRLLGVNEKLFFPAPSFAIRGGCFTPNTGQFAQIEAYAFALLDAIGFDHGAAHIELMLTAEGPALIEINPRLVGARIARLISAARTTSVHADLIALHTQGTLPAPAPAPTYAITRWIAAPHAGTLAAITLPPLSAPGVVGASIIVAPGAQIGPPYDNADRLGCIITSGHIRAEAEFLAETLVAATQVVITAQSAQAA